MRSGINGIGLGIIHLGSEFSGHGKSFCQNQEFLVKIVLYYFCKIRDQGLSRDWNQGARITDWEFLCTHSVVNIMFFCSLLQPGFLLATA